MATESMPQAGNDVKDERDDPIDTIHRKLAQARAILDVTGSLGAVELECVSPPCESLNNVLWAARDLIDEAREALDRCEAREEAS